MEKFLRITISLLIAGLMGFSTGYSQEASKTELETVLRSFKNYRFGTMSLYEIRNLSGLKAALKSKEESKSAGTLDEKVVKEATVKEAVPIIEDGVKQGKTVDEIAGDISDAGMITPPRAELEGIFNYYKAKQTSAGQEVSKAFLVTTRAQRGEVPKQIIGLIVSKKVANNIEKHLKTASPSDIYTYDEMTEIPLDTNFNAKNLYDLMMNELIQQNYDNRTLEAQGIGNTEWFAHKVYGKAATIVDNEADMQSYDIQRFLQISDAQPANYGVNENEVVISPDLISWKRYGRMYKEDGSVDSAFVTNTDLPKVGLELRYGIDEINYPSLWSERLTASALWRSVKLGLILPTNGWANITKDFFDEQRKMTYANVGIAGAFDFPLKVIPKSGLFHFSFGYVYGDAVNPDYIKNGPRGNNGYLTGDSIAYIIRGNATLQYTFGLAIDEDYLLRFGIGGTVYNAERWFDETKFYTDSVTGNIEKRTTFKNFNDETVGGLSGRIDFMARGVVTPYGASVQYFDESLFGNIWLQIPIYENMLALRFDIKGSAPIFRKNKHDWENSNGVFFPMIRLIASF